jgi:hypothetical protein
MKFATRLIASLIASFAAILAAIFAARILQCSKILIAAC